MLNLLSEKLSIFYCSNDQFAILWIFHIWGRPCCISFKYLYLQKYRVRINAEISSEFPNRDARYYSNWCPMLARACSLYKVKRSWYILDNFGESRQVLSKYMFCTICIEPVGVHNRTNWWQNPVDVIVAA